MIRQELVKSHTAGVRIVRGAGWDRQHARACSGHFVFGRSRSGLGGGCCTGEDKDNDKCAHDMFHSEILPKLYFCKKISLDKPDDVTIGYKLK